MTKDRRGMTRGKIRGGGGFTLWEGQLNSPNTTLTRISLRIPSRFSAGLHRAEARFTKKEMVVWWSLTLFQLHSWPATERETSPPNPPLAPDKNSWVLCSPTALCMLLVNGDCIGFRGDGTPICRCPGTGDELLYCYIQCYYRAGALGRSLDLFDPALFVFFFLSLYFFLFFSSPFFSSPAESGHDPKVANPLSWPTIPGKASPH